MYIQLQSFVLKQFLNNNSNGLTRGVFTAEENPDKLGGTNLKTLASLEEVVSSRLAIFQTTAYLRLIYQWLFSSLLSVAKNNSTKNKQQI